MLRYFCHSLFLRYGVALAGFFGHLRNRRVEVEVCAPYSASDLVDGTFCSAFQLADRSSEWGTTWSTISGLRSIVVSALLMISATLSSRIFSSAWASTPLISR
jgi:hypothetical protein